MKYTGSCHCSAVSYMVEADISKPMTCNCSHCSRKGFILSFVPAAAFTLHTGEENLTEYRFNTKKIQHLFCKTCGVQSFGRGTDPAGAETIMVNVRCLADVDISTLTCGEYNGKEY